jgi:hypothetical protein
MSPSFWRALRATSVPLLVVTTLAVGGALAWLTHRREAGYQRTPTTCSRAIDEAFEVDASTVSDAVLLRRLLVHRERCMGDAAYVDRARRLMLDLRRTADARALLDEAERRGALAADELAAQRAWVDIEESHLAAANGQGTRARAAQARAAAAVERLRARWPEWAVPYTLMRELQRTAVLEPGGPAPMPDDPTMLERIAHRRFANGAIVRSLTMPQALVVAFLAGAIGVLGLAAILAAATSIREMQRMTTSAIAEAEAGYVELAGTLHRLPRADAVVGPLTRHAGVWYALETNFGAKGSRTFRERSSQAFVLRDATGEATIDPSGATVRTRHSVTRFGGTGGLTSSRGTTERMLWEGDEAYVLGELALVRSGSTVTRRVRLPEDGRRLVVSNYSEARLIVREMAWLVLGAVAVVISVSAITWGYAQRYQVRVLPGVLE